MREYLKQTLKSSNAVSDTPSPAAAATTAAAATVAVSDALVIDENHVASIISRVTRMPIGTILIS